MKAISLIVLIGVHQFAFSQKNDTLRKFLDANFSLASRNKMTYPAIVFKSGHRWILQASYTNNNPLLVASFIDKALTVFDGPFTAYYRNKKKATDGYYQNGYRKGIWRYWYTNGRLKDSEVIRNNQLVNTWYTWHDNGNLHLLIDYAFSDSATDLKKLSNDRKPLIESADLDGYKNGRFLRYFSNGQVSDSGGYTNDKKTGPWKIWFANGQLEAIGNFSNDSLQGEWRWYRESGVIATKETYRDNKLLDLRCFDDTGNYTGEYCGILKPPVPLGNPSDFENYMLDNIILPNELRNIQLEGTVTITCRITRKAN